MKITLFGAASATVLAMIATSPAGAQTTPAAPASGQQAPQTIGEIVVTAQRTSEKLINVPLAIQAVSGDALAARGVTSLANLSEVTPSFVFVEQGFQPAVSLRGATGDVQGIAGDPSVAVSLDGVPYASQEYLAAGFFDVSRIEVLRGPQGTVAGRNSTGGAVNIISNRPTDTFSAGLNATYGNFNTRASDGYISGPLIEGVLNARLAFKVNYRDGILNNVDPHNPGHIGSDAAERGGRLSLEYKPQGSRFTAFLTAEEYRNQTTGPATVYEGTSVPQGEVVDARALLLAHTIVPILPTNHPIYGSNSLTVDQFYREGGPSLNHTIDGGSLRMQYNIADGWNVASISGYRAYNVSGKANIDASIGSTWAGQQPEQAKQYSEELNLTGNITKDLDILLGGLYLRQDGQVNLIVHYYPYTLVGLSPSPFAAGFRVVDYQNLTSGAGFGQLRWRFLPKFQLTLGGRYSQDTKTFAEQVYGPATATAPFLTNAGLGYPSPTSKSFNAFTPRVALDYKPINNTTLYVSYAKGYKSGGYNVATLLSTLAAHPSTIPAFEPERNETYEIGAKTRWLDGAITANVAAFASKESNVQVQLTTPVGQVVTNAASAHVNGVELELHVLPTRAWQLGFNATYLDAAWDKYCPLNPNRPDLNATYPALTAGQCGVMAAPPAGSQNDSGEPLERAPKFSGSANVDHTWDLRESGTITAGLVYHFTTRTYFSPYHEANLSQGSYGLLDLRANYESRSGHWSVTAFVRNATDARYLTNVVPGPVGLAQLTTPGVATTLIPGTALDGVIGDPRTFGVTLGYKY